MGCGWFPPCGYKQEIWIFLTWLWLISSWWVYTVVISHTVSATQWNTLWFFLTMVLSIYREILGLYYVPRLKVYFSFLCLAGMVFSHLVLSFFFFFVCFLLRKFQSTIMHDMCLIKFLNKVYFSFLCLVVPRSGCSDWLLTKWRWRISKQMNYRDC